MQVAGNSLHRLVCLTSASVLLIALTAASAEDVPQIQHHQADSASHEGSCAAEIQGPAVLGGFESLQVETSDITRYEQFFESVLRAPVVQRMDHPQVDSLRGYCYRGVLIVVRQDLRTPRPTGWEGTKRGRITAHMAEKPRSNRLRLGYVVFLREVGDFPI